MAGVIGDVLALGKSHSNLDYYYGPYTTLDEAYIKVPKRIRGLGLTIGIYLFKEDSNGEYIYNKNKEDIITGQIYKMYDKNPNSEEQKYSISSIKEYLWKKGLENEDLKEKVEEYVLEIDDISYTTDTINNTITFSIKVSGRGFGVQTNIYLGSNRIISESTVLNEYLNITITAPENPGNYIYTISAVDSILGNGAQTTHEVIWKEVDVKINTSSSIYTYKVKSLLNLLNANFTFLIFKVDSINISKISILYGNNHLDVYNEGEEYLDTYTINISLLTGIESGNLILIKIEGNLTQTFIKNVVLLTASGIYTQCEGIVPSRVYNGLSFSASFKFEAENIGNYLVVIKDNDLNIIYNSSLLSYNDNIITLTLNDSSLSDIKTSSQHTLYVYIGDSLSYNYIFNTITLLYVPNSEQLSDIDDLTKFLDSLNFGLSTNQNITLQSYILDLTCYIPYSQNNSSVFLFGNITITKDIIMFRNIIYPTPIQQKISIGFMCNVKSSYLNEDYYYDALFINGVLCYKTPSEGSPNYSINSNIEQSFIDNISNVIRLYYNTEGPILQSPENFVLERNYKSRNPGSDVVALPILNITPITNILTKADLTPNLINQINNNKITIDNVLYDVIDTTSYRVGTFGELGDEKYNINDMLNSFCQNYSISRLGEESDVISKLAKAIKKDPSKIPSNYLVLTRLIVKSKKLLQKFVCVPCLWSYGNISGYLLASTLGTSTLEYALPNFTFMFFTDKTFTTKSNVSLIPKIDRNLSNLLTYSNEITENTLYYEENELVAKADYMESSHLNNTPTAMFYNALVSQQNGYTVLDSHGDDILILQNPVAGKLNAIEGIPIVLSINNINYGSFMLNIGKTGKSIGFGPNGISLEGTSNADNSEMSSRFDFATIDTLAKNYLENIENIDNVTTINEDFVKFLNQGLEYRYSEHELDAIGDNEGSENDPYSEYLRILKMWHWVYTHETYTKLEFEQMFNFDFFALYYIQMMTFGLTDNLGKNCMFDLFNVNGQWYVRPYDMDSLAGLENNGNDNLSPVIEISDLFVLDEATKNIKVVNYLGEESPRFPFSSKTSNLWIRFYQNLKSDIELFYKNLRNLGYSSEAVISLCKKEVIDKLGITLYNKDFLNKYLTNLIETELFAYGNRWFRFLDWILKRFDFCDTYFRYNVYNVNTSGDGEDYRIKYSIPQYTLYSYNNNGTTVTNTDWGTETKQNFLKFDSITKQNMYFSPKYIIDDDGIFLTGFTTLTPRVKLNNLVTYSGTWNNLINVVDLSENTYLLEMTINNISTSSSKAVIPKSVMTLLINNSSLIPNLLNFSNLKTIIFSNCEGNINLSDCPKLESITITSCKNVNLTLTNCGSSEKYINLAITATTFGSIVFNECYINYLGLPNLSFNISFTGQKSYIKVVNLYNSTILNRELNISNLVAETLILNSISLVNVITSETKTYRFLGLQESNITLFGTIANTFDGSKISNINNVKMITGINDTVITNLINNTYTSSTAFRMYRCYEIQYVTNLNINSSSSYLFYECKKLKSVTNSSITASGAYMFGRCYDLETLPTSNNVSTINLSDTNGNSMFLSCQKLSYDLIEKVLDNNMETKYWNSTTNSYLSEDNGSSSVTACKITNYNHFLYNKGYLSNVTIDLSKYTFGTSMDYCFCLHNWGGEENTNKNNSLNITITYLGKLSKTLTSAYSIFASMSNYKVIIDSNILEDCLKLTNLSRAFCYLNYSGENDYFFDVPILPNNTNLNISGIFIGSKLNINNWKDGNNNINIPSKVINCSSAFGNVTFSESVEVSNWFANCTHIKNLTSCFNNCNNFTCNNVFNISSSNYAVNIAGIFARSNMNSISIAYGFLGNWYSDPKTSDYTWNNSTLSDNNRLGPYNGVKIKLSDSYESSLSINISGVIGNTLYNMNNVLQNATIDNSNGPIDLTLSINTKNCIRICLNLKVLDTSLDTPNVVILYLDIEHSNIEDATQAFENVKILDINNAISLPNTLINCNYMFAGTNITRFPSGISNCSRLSDISYMFYNCNKLNELIPSQGLYFLPISVTKIDHLFENCNLLHGGIPKNFILTITTTETYIDENELELEREVITKNNITSLISTFAYTAILLSNTTFENNSNYEELNISDMFPNVINVEGLFYFMCSTTSYSYSLGISPLCFSNCVKCDDLFNSACISLPLNCDFLSATSLRFTFASGFTNWPKNLTLIMLGNKVSDMTGIFSATNNTRVNTNVTNNLENLLSKKKGIYTGMLYGYGDDFTLNEYKYVAPSRSIRWTAHE